MSIEQNICDAVDIIVYHAIDQAKFAKTVVAQIVECVDSVAGKYKVKYQDSVYFATTDNTTVQYKKNTDVYVLIPEGDFSKDKKILGTVSAMGVEYIEQVEQDAGFDYIGSDLITDLDRFELCSYREDNIVLYDRASGVNKIQIDQAAAADYFLESEYLIFGAEFKTAIPRENRNYGNYGLGLIISFTDTNNTNELVYRKYELDIDNMLGQPYNFTKFTRQIATYPINGAEFNKIETVYMFANKFPHQAEDKPADIFIQAIELSGANKNGFIQDNAVLSILTPSGSTFPNSAGNTIALEAQVKLRGRVLDPAEHKLAFYWFKENNLIDVDNIKYNQYGGKSWECLNNFISLNENQVDWLPGGPTFYIQQEDCSIVKNKYKCVCLYNEDTPLSCELVITNYNGLAIEIVSSKGTEFYYDQGTTTLTCVVDNPENLVYNYKWSKINAFGNYEAIDFTTEENARYAEASELKAAIEAGYKDESIFKEQPYSFTGYDLIINSLENTDSFDAVYNGVVSYLLDKTVERVKNDKIINLAAKTIVDYTTYSCAVSDAESNYVGTASIKLTNSFDDKGVYGLVIHGGDQVFKYDESGRSPNHNTQENPIDILPLSFSIFDEGGNRIEEDLTEITSAIEWRIPLFNTMLKTSGGANDADYSVVKDALNLDFDIVSHFNRNAANNQILLEVGFRGKVLTAQTNFSFLKEGDSGTNGTDFVCRILPNVAGNIGIIPTIVWDGANADPVLNYTPIEADKWFKVQLWDLAQGNEVDASKLKVKWSMLANKYRSNIMDDTLISIDELGNCSVNKTIFGNVDNTANIVKVEVEYENKKYFATLPIVLAGFQTPSLYRAKIKGGFNSVVYSSDGRRPQYDNLHPFEVICEYQENGTWIDISTAASRINYEWLVKGQVYDTINKTIVPYNGLVEVPFVDTRHNEKKFRPVDPYDGVCVTNAIRVDLKDAKNNNAWVGTLYYPIYFGLNRFGITAINDWDGNSITLDEEGGMVLSPQVGAGKKDDNNRFTGVVIGTVDDKSDSKKETGLVGYSAGQRSIFLDAETGKAEFGVQGKGRIVLDPTNDTAVIQSGNYSESKKTGMMIDFTTPEIKYGSGKFKVDANGVLNATDGVFSGTIHASGGNIGNWQIKNNRLQTENGSVYLGIDGFKVGDKFSVDSDGTLHASGANISGVIHASDGEFTGVIHARDGEFSGTITATGGTIGGIQIGRNDGLKGVGWSISPSGITCSNITMGGKTFIPSTIYDNNVWWYPDGIPDSSSVTCITSLNPLYDSTGQYVTGFSPSKVTFKYNGSQTKYTCIATS